MKTLSTQKTIFIGVIALFAVACTQERPYDKEFKDKNSAEVPRAKSDLSLITDHTGGDEYLYVPSAVNNTRTTDATFPGYMGDAKIVKLKFSETALQVLEVEKEDRFGGNPVNSKPVLEIPISHIDFKCSEDADGKCTNKEEENRDITWSKKRFFKLDAAAMAVQEVNYLPIEITNLFYPCYNEVGADVVDVKIDNDSLNIQVEKQYRARLECAEIKSLSDLTFRVRNHYSLVKLKSIETPNYNKLLYTRAEEGMFGFFTTQTLKLDGDNNESEGSEKTYVNRWAPNKIVKYHLTSNFNKPENQKIKEMTLAGIKNINATLEKTGASLRIEVSEDTVDDSQIGDIRVSSVVLVEDPIAFPLLGYGPSTANPRTGEIVQGRTAMYLGVLKQIVKNTYEDFVEEKINKTKAAQTKTTTETDASGDLVTIGEEEGTFTLADNLKTFSGSMARPNISKYVEAKQKISAEKNEHSHVTPLKSLASVSKTSSDLKSPIGKVPSEKVLRNHALGLKERKIQLAHVARMEDDVSVKETIMSLHCYYSAEGAEFNESLEDAVDKVISEVGLKPWNDLTDTEKETVMAVLLPVVYLPTFIHEMGHNLGLRHNFGGSEDKANFYSPKELAEMGIKATIPYSTVMEYSYKQTNELPVMGKYDIAALRYGYAEQVEMDDGNVIELGKFRNPETIPANVSKTVRAFKYCTDEHSSVNPNCNRFDEGTTLVEITEHLINAYNKNYVRRNFRNNRLSFSLVDDLSYARRIKGTMQGLRAMLERYEDIKQTYGLTDDNEVWEQLDFLKDLKAASRIGGKFLISVLNTPDTLCAVATKQQPLQILGVLPIRALSPNAISCLDGENVQLREPYIVVGEAGKSFQSRKDPSSKNPYIDQIDVRGVWMDKLLAAQALVGRVTGIETYDEFTGNYLDLTDMRAEVQSALTGLLLDEVVTEVPIYTVTGQVLVAEIPVQMYDAAEGQHTHRIPKHIFSFVRKAFGLPNTITDFQEQLAKTLGRELPSREQLSDSTSLLNATKVVSAIPMGHNPAEYISTKIGLSQLFVNMQSEVSATQLVSREIVLTLTSLGEEKVTEITEKILAGEKAPADASDAEKLAYELGAEVLIRFLQGGFKAPVFYEHMLMSLAAN